MAASEYLTLGRGKLYFAPFLADGVTPGGMVPFGNCPSFNLNVSFEEISHMDSQGGFKEEDENAMISREVIANITCDDLKPENMVKFFMGSSEQVTQATATAATYAITGAQQGQTYVIGFSASNPFGAQGLSNVSVADATPTTYVAGDDYTLDPVRGTITIVRGGGIADETDITVTYDVATQSRTRVQSGNQQIEGALLFLADNAVGKNQNAYMPFCKIRPEGDLPLITDDWAELNFNIRALKPAVGELITLEAAN